MKTYNSNWLCGVDRLLTENVILEYKCAEITDYTDYYECMGGSQYVKRMDAGTKLQYYLTYFFRNWITIKK